MNGKPLAHLNALRAFEASARHQSFALAAAELHVTPAAVGQLVRSLEDGLGTPLFLRGSSGRARLQPTEAAERALPDIRAGLDRLAMGMERLREGAGHGVLTLTVSPAFAAKWLLPRLERFQLRHPETDVRLETRLKALDFVAQRVDIGVRYGLGHWPGLSAVKLLDEDLFPVCAPRLLQATARFREPEDLLKETLIHDESMDDHAGFPGWASWLEAAGVRTRLARCPLRINNSAAVLQAAAEGQGVALARSVMVRDDLAAGRLVRLFPAVEYRSPLSYYVVYRSECAGLPRLAAFRDWLLEEAGQPPA